MNIKNKFIISIIGLSFLVSGCTKNEKTNISTIDDNSNEIIEVNINEIEKNEKYQMLQAYFSDSSKVTYDFESKTYKSGNLTINFPILSEYIGELSKQYINDSVDMFVAKISKKYSSANNLVFNYEITKKTDSLFCFKLTSEPSNSELVYSEALIIDLKSTNTISPDILFIGEDNGINDAIKKHSIDKDKVKYDPNNMIMYIEGENLFFIEKDNINLSDKSTISIPIKELFDYMNIDFGEHPAS